MREWYSLVDCLEDVSNFWTYGKDMVTYPSYNIYVPTKEHIIPKPDLTQDNDDETGYKFGI
jgi:hypothetical protein